MTEPAAARIPPQPWMTSPGAQAVLAALASGGAEARFVGGCVRDALAGLPVKDVDIATPAEPHRVMELLAAAGIRAIPTGLQHGTVTALAEGQSFEITTLRRDMETDGRRARVEFSDDWREDAARRDLTINALFSSPAGEVYDYFGGVADLRDGRICFVGDPETRIREDVLRLLRFFRFHTWYGRAPMDAGALDACRRLAPLLPGLSSERISAELFRLLAAPDPAGMVETLLAERILDPILPQLRNLSRLRSLVWIATLCSVAADPLLRLAALLPNDPSTIDAVAHGLRLSNAQRDRLAAITRTPALTPDVDEPTLRRRLYYEDAQALRDCLLLGWADVGTLSPPEPWQDLLARVDAWRVPKFPLSGDDAHAAGIPFGPAVGQALQQVESWWIDQAFSPDRDACLAQLRSLAARS